MGIKDDIPSSCCLKWVSVRLQQLQTRSADEVSWSLYASFQKLSLVILQELTSETAGCAAYDNFCYMRKLRQQVEILLRHRVHQVSIGCYVNAEKYAARISMVVLLGFGACQH